MEHRLEKKRKICTDKEVDLVHTMTTLREREAELEVTKLALKDLIEATQPIAGIVEPLAAGVEP